MVHEYLTERLEADGEQPSLLRRFTDYYTQLVTDTCEQLTGPNSSDATHTLQAELGNVRSILERSVRKRHVAEGLTLALMLVPFWEHPEHLAEGRSWLSRLIALAPNAPTLTGDGQIAAARLAILAGDLHGAAEVLDITAAATSEPTGRADMLAWVCAVQLLQGKLDEAEETLQTVLDASAAGVMIPDEVSPAYLRALLAVERNDAATTDLLAVALAEADQEDNPSRAITILCKQAERELTTNRTLNCARILADALVRAQVARNPRARISPLIGLGDLAAEHQSRDEAVHHYREALDLAITCQDAISQVRILERIAVLGAAPRIQPDLLGAIGLADTLRTRFGHGRTAYDEGRIAPALRRARELLGDVEFERIRATGDTRSIAQVLQGLEEPRRAKQRPSPTIPANAKASSPTITQLTRREREVVQQISRGHTNKQIAATLGMAERTVDSHIGNIRQKLQVQSRAQIAVWAVAHGLSNPD
jgi:non-specific serine/threonine protein kinase